MFYKIQSKYQTVQTQIHIVTPDEYDNGRCYRTLYLLPVEKFDDKVYGDIIGEIVSHGLHNTYDIICVYPTFSDWPWYADHPDNPEIRQESYFLKDVVPFVEEKYPVIREKEGRFLFGFSKSGWGAYSLILRHPEMFERASAWDAPLYNDSGDKWFMDAVFGNFENFKHYCIRDLLKLQAENFKLKSRLVLGGYGNFQSHVNDIHLFMRSLEIPHDYLPGPQREHTWDSGWVPEIVECLLGERPEV